MARKHEPPPSPAAAPGSAARTIVSLLLFVHLVCLFVALASNYLMSPMQIRLLNVLAPYIQFFKIQPTAPYHLTDGTEISHDHVLEVEVTAGPQKGEIVRLPEGGVSGWAPRQREQTLARTVAVTSYFGAEQNTAALAKALGTRMLDLGENEEVVVRCFRRQPQERLFDATSAATPADPSDDAYLNAVYEARVWRDQYGQVQLLKIEEREVVAPLEKQSS
ncbi:MAG: hypothetical protein KY475_04700 [Planctomycetes bacterium]|nr:hypothetical protein [Planctomycetota bacterium]